jgi:hypothetical protein
MTRISSARARIDPPPIDLLALRDEVLDYLSEHSVGRQGAIAKLVGLRRETICSYAQKRGALTDVATLQRLLDWMQTDKKQNGHS